MSTKPLDPYTAKAEEGNDATPVEQKFKELNSIIKDVKVAMLTSIDSSSSPEKQDKLHSRAMAPVQIAASKFPTESTNRSPTGPSNTIAFTFIFNLHSGKLSEFESASASGDHAPPPVNISYYSPSTTSWASISGTPKVITDKEVIKKLWRPELKAWFGDLEETGKTGDWRDDRVGAVQVTVNEIRYWLKTRSLIGETYEVAKGAVTGETAAPGVLRTIQGVELGNSSASAVFES